MKLFYSPASPYVRKVLITAHETGQSDDLDLVACAANPVNRDQSVVALNPLGKIPALALDDGTVLYDSRVICQYLDSRHSGDKLYPSAGSARWSVLQREALADGLLDAALLARYETMLRPREFQWTDWINGQTEKINSSLDQMEQDVRQNQALDAGQISTACALGYLDFRFPLLDWRSAHPALEAWFNTMSARESMVTTVPQG